jgi:hypothetical protein
MLDGDENETRVAEAVYGRKPRSKLAVVQNSAGSPLSTFSTFVRMSVCVC